MLSRIFEKSLRKYVPEQSSPSQNFVKDLDNSLVESFRNGKSYEINEDTSTAESPGERRDSLSRNVFRQ